MNRLRAETSPYLLQHADNPVHWQPWDEAALDQARREDKPILLSVGYSACHWCHVMAHESFEDPATAELMNRLYVNIKVDREERPDIDGIYQTAHQLMMRRPGGWPLTMFLDPADHRPFFGGTYFPDQPRHGMPSFKEVLEKVGEYFRDNRDEVRDAGEAMVNALAQLEPVSANATQSLGAEPLDDAREKLAAQFDRDNGGLGTAPKFPHPASLELLLRHWRRSASGKEPDTDALFLVALTLTRMADGGIYDQLGGGFCRYSVDAHWTIPHFEKMLYDNGPLLALYSQLWLASGDDLYRRIANETADWALREMQSPDGAFYSTLDADSEGHEGKFYVWTPEEVKNILPGDEYEVFAPRFGLDQPPNFEGAWHLRVYQSLDDVAKATGRELSEVRRLLGQARQRLREVRDQRIWPGRDEKILAGWNGLMIRGLAIASRALRRPELADAAARAVDFIRGQMIVDGQLVVCHKDGRARFNAYLDDHAYLLDAVIELLQSRWDSQHLQFASWLADQLLERFEDKDNGGFYFTAHDHEALIHRAKPMSDDATPAGNGIAALALNRLGYILGDSRYIDAAEGALRAGWPAMSEHPHGHAALLAALEEYLNEPTTVILRGKRDEMAEWAESLNAIYAPGRLVLAIPDDAADLAEVLIAKKATGELTAYVCHGTSCSASLTSSEELAAELAAAN